MSHLRDGIGSHRGWSTRVRNDHLWPHRGAHVFGRTGRRTCSLAPRAGDLAQVGPSARWWKLEDGPGWRRSGNSIGPRGGSSGRRTNS